MSGIDDTRVAYTPGSSAPVCVSLDENLVRASTVGGAFAMFVHIDTARRLQQELTKALSQLAVGVRVAYIEQGDEGIVTEGRGDEWLVKWDDGIGVTWMSGDELRVLL